MCRNMSVAHNRLTIKVRQITQYSVCVGVGDTEEG